jgi:hypothetical protein
VTGSWVRVAVRSAIGDGEAGLIAAMGDAFTAVETAMLIAYTEQPLPQWLLMPPACAEALVVSDGCWRSLLRINPNCCLTAGNPLCTTASLDLPGARS